MKAFTIHFYYVLWTYNPRLDNLKNKISTRWKENQ